MAKVSVVMPVYNGERFLEEAISSVLNQTLSDFEFVIVDDGSTDSTPAILEQFRQLDPRIQVHRQDNQGQAPAQNLGLSLATNCYVAMMDADDRMLPNRLERQLRFFTDNPGCSLICSYSYLIDAKGKRIGKSQNEVDVAAGIRELDPSRFLEIVHPSVMMKKEDILKLGGYNGNLTTLEDRDLWGRVVTNGMLIKCQPEFLFEYRLHGKSRTMINIFEPNIMGRFISLNILRRLKGQRDLSLQEVQNLLDSRPFLTKCLEERKVFATRLYKNATRMYAEKDMVLFALFFGAAMALRPLDTAKRALGRVHTNLGAAAIAQPRRDNENSSSREG